MARSVRILSSSRLGTRGAFLLTQGLFFLLYGGSQIWPAAEWLRRAETVFRTQILPAEAWGIMWAVVGAACIVCAFIRRDRIGFSASVALLIFWAVTGVASQIWGEATRGYVSAATWGCFAVITMIMSGVPEVGRITIDERGGDAD